MSMPPIASSARSSGKPSLLQALDVAHNDLMRLPRELPGRANYQAHRALTCHTSQIFQVWMLANISKVHMTAAIDSLTSEQSIMVQDSSMVGRGRLGQAAGGLCVLTNMPPADEVPAGACRASGRAAHL